MQSVILGRSPHHNSRLRIHAAAAAAGAFSRTHRTKAAKDELGLEQELGERSLRGLCGAWGRQGASGAGAEQAAKAQSRALRLPLFLLLSPRCCSLGLFVLALGTFGLLGGLVRLSGFVSSFPVLFEFGVLFWFAFCLFG